MELGHRGMPLAIYSGNKVVGTLFVTKTGIRWLERGRHWTLKGHKVVGTLVSWAELDQIAAGHSP